MNPDTRMEDARKRMELRPPVRLEYDGQLNDDPNQRAEYPRQMYRATKEEHLEMMPGAEGFDDTKVRDKTRVVNRYDGLLCDTTIAHDADAAEALSADGWDVSPKAAHGIIDGLAKVTSAKDDRIAELERQLAAQGSAAASEPEKRGPGRPRLSPQTDA